MTRKTISIVGLGKLGKPIYGVLRKHYNVIGLDKGDSLKILGNLTFIAVPTPSIHYKFTSEYVEDVLKKIKGTQAIAIISTLMPGETDKLQKKYPNLNLIYNPSFVALGTVAKDFTHPDFVLIGSNKNVDFLKQIYITICPKKPKFCVLTPLEAEIAKLTLNCYITTKITFANQIGNLCYRAKVSSESILKTVGSDSRVGNKYFRAGLGYGGPCFPRDNLAMSAYMIDNGLDPVLNRAVHNLNENQVDEIINRIEATGAYNIGFENLSYKKGTDIMEESHLKKIFDILKTRGYGVAIGKGDVTVGFNGIIDVNEGGKNDL